MRPDLDAVFRSEWGAVVATLARRLGDLQAAEDAAADAFATAAVRWPVDGVPPNPGGWLTTTAWRRALDQIRRDRPLSRYEAEFDDLPSPALTSEGTLMPDDRLALMFACCHPALAPEVRVALTLRFVAGLTTAEIASAFLAPEPTIAQRLVRAKRKIKTGGIRFDVPPPAAMPERLEGVQQVVYLVFNEGYAASAGDELLRGDLCDEAIWLGRLLHRMLPADAETAGLLALMLLHHSRVAARTAPDGRPIPLGEQNRGRWDPAMIADGIAILDQAIERRTPGPFQVQAAIAALHAQAPSLQQTDWPQIAALYGELARQAPSPVVEINRAVAVGEADGPLAGLAVLAPVLANRDLANYAPMHAAHAELLERAGDTEAAARARTAALAATGNTALRTELSRRWAEISKET